MKKIKHLAIGAGLALGLSAVVAPLSAGAAGAAGYPGSPFGQGASHAVFVQTDNTAGNQVVAYQRSDDGTLSLTGTYDTGGVGGVLNGSAVDHLASQGSLTYDQQNSLLYAVNAGSNTVSAFSVQGDHLRLQQVISSGGTFPVSVAVHDGLVYVLNAENGGSVQGYVSFFGHLFPLPGSNRNLGLTIPTDNTQFTNTPGQVAFSPNGSQLIVTTKANRDDIDVFHVGFFGELSPAPVVNQEGATVPFGVTFDSAGHLVVAESSTDSAVATFTLNGNGSLTSLSAVPTGQAATCWVAPAQGFFYASNAGSASVSTYRASAGGQLSLLGRTATDPGTVDASASDGGAIPLCPDRWERDRGRVRGQWQRVTHQPWIGDGGRGRRR